MRDQCLLIAVSVDVENADSQVELTHQTSFTQPVLLPLHFRRGAGLAAVHAEAEPVPARGGRPVRERLRDHAHVLGRNSVELGNSSEKDDLISYILLESLEDAKPNLQEAIFKQVFK